MQSLLTGLCGGNQLADPPSLWPVIFLCPYIFAPIVSLAMPASIPRHADPQFQNCGPLNALGISYSAVPVAAVVRMCLYGGMWYRGIDGRGYGRVEGRDVGSGLSRIFPHPCPHYKTTLGPRPSKCPFMRICHTILLAPIVPTSTPPLPYPLSHPLGAVP